jgi:hypothetical protein
MEKRNSNRHKTDQSIVCTFFTSHSCDGTFDGRMQNYCECGMYAELQANLKEGTVLLVRTTGSEPEGRPSKIENGFRSVSLVEVKWSKPISANGVDCFGTGLKHLVVQ